MFADIDILKLAESFRSQGDFLVVPDFVPAPLLQRLLAELPRLESAVHRNYIPRHKKGGSISRFELDRLAPSFGELYRQPALAEYLDRITGRKLLPCPPADPHTYALYYYTEEGDHIGWHYDSSYYRGKRFSVLIGLVDRSDSRLEYRLPAAAGGGKRGQDATARDRARHARAVRRQAASPPDADRRQSAARRAHAGIRNRSGHVAMVALRFQHEGLDRVFWSGQRFSTTQRRLMARTLL